MAINFPDSPSEGETHTHTDGKTWTYNNGSWSSAGSGGSNVTGGGVQSSITDGTKSVSFNNSNEVVMNTDLNVDAINISGHILPSSNADFDLGNAEYKIRHLFLSDNSLRFGKNGTADISGETVSFGKDNLDRNAEVYTDADGVTLPNLQSAGKKGDIRIIGDQMHVCIQTAENDNVSNNWYNATPSAGGGGSYSNTNVDAHLNNVNHSSMAGRVLAKTSTGFDYEWIVPYGDSYVEILLNSFNVKPAAGNVLSWNGSDYAWVAQSGGSNYSNSDVNTHLNVSPTSPTSGHVLSWNGSDFAWVAQSSGGGGSYSNTNVDAHLNNVNHSSMAGRVLAKNSTGNDYEWIVPYGDSYVELLFNSFTSKPAAGHVLSWNGSDYAWVAQSGGSNYTDSDVNTHLNTPTAGTGTDFMLTWTGYDYQWAAPVTTYIDNHLNVYNGTSYSAANKFLSWDGAQYVWDVPSLSESDPIFTASPAGSITNTKITNWDTAHGWGNHASAGYLTSFSESDPIFTASPAGSITNTKITNWDTAHGWGNHASAGYVLTSDLDYYTDSDVNTHLNTPASGAGTNYMLTWTGYDYQWGATVETYIDNHLNVYSGTSYSAANKFLTWNGTQYVWAVPSGGGGGGAYGDSDVNTHLNQTGSITDGYVLSWNATLLSGAGDYEWVAQSSGGGGGGAYGDSDVNTLLGTSPSAPSLNYVLSWGSGGYTWVAQSGGSGGSLSSRTTVDTSSMSLTSGSKTLTAGASATGSISGYKSYSLFKVSINHPDLWVTIYTDSSSMSADSSRLYTQDPSPGSGVIAEFISNSSNQDIIVSPTTIGFNMDSTPSGNIYLKVVNIGSSNLSSDFDIELTILQLEA